MIRRMVGCYAKKRNNNSKFLKLSTQVSQTQMYSTSWRSVGVGAVSKLAELE